MNPANPGQIAIQYLRGLQQAGVSDLPVGAASRIASADIDLATVDNSAQTEEPSEAPSGPVQENGVQDQSSEPALMVNETSSGYGPGLDESSRIEALKVLNEQVCQCQHCDELAKCRTQTVFGTGNPRPRLAFFGEAPGADEDRIGEPFVGRAGQLLTRIIEACKMSREDVYIFNTVKCRPPGNRNPSEQEIDNCWAFAQRQLEILQPEFICCLGSVAARTLLGSKESVGRMRGRFHSYRDSQVVVTYHPAYLLRTPAAKAKTWDDLQMLMDAMGIVR